jgi:hypothetical protein
VRRALGARARRVLGLEAIAITLAELIPAHGEPVGVQRELEFRLAHGLDWTVKGGSTSKRCASATAAPCRP